MAYNNENPPMSIYDGPKDIEYVSGGDYSKSKISPQAQNNG